MKPKPLATSNHLMAPGDLDDVRRRVADELTESVGLQFKR